VSVSTTGFGSRSTSKDGLASRLFLRDLLVSFESISVIYTTGLAVVPILVYQEVESYTVWNCIRLTESFLSDTVESLLFFWTKRYCRRSLCHRYIASVVVTYHKRE
jgi:hypothetical protein